MDDRTPRPRRSTRRRPAWPRRLLTLSLGLSATLAVFVAAALAWPMPDMPRVGAGGDVVVRNVAVVDVVGGRTVPGRDVVIRAGRIASIAAYDARNAYAGLVAVDGRGRFLAPGLWDMHVHSLKVSPQYTHPLSIANGVTGVREMWGCAGLPDPLVACGDDIARWRAALRDGSRLAPRYIQRSSYAVNGPRGVPADSPAYFRASTAREARALVAHHAADRVDLIKTYTELSPAAYAALAAEARTRGVVFAGHLPVRVPLSQALAAGQGTIEHPRVFLLECYRDAAAFRALPEPMRAYDTAMRARLVDRHDRAHCAGAMAAMARSRTWWTPTLQVLRMEARAGDAAFRNDPRLRYVPYVLRAGLWAPDADASAQRAAEVPGRDVAGELYALAMRTVGDAHAAGVGILAGTDAGDTYVFPGFGMHDELRELVHAGLSPADALRSATIRPAQFSGMDRDFGSVDVGKAADLILLDADPLADIANTRRIAALLFNGRYLDRPALDALLHHADRQAGSVRMNLQLLSAALRSPIIRAQAAD
ncbi:amidohydrolase family protein [Cognatilysobacter tabacisoli]|uniref:amidohydrolase family protein n=1 Tax=Cognatilysobacter tabacisoli TaxID=2315424 RepID=UPI000E6AEAFC|nr:amidohydrolase family protein [Lysobacter tabacisoli]